MKNKILKIINNSEEPFSTKEIQERIMETRTKVFSRLQILWGEGLIKGKFIDNGTWIWWKK